MTPQAMAEAVCMGWKTNRMVYTRLLVTRLPLDEKINTASDHRKEEKVLPLSTTLEYRWLQNSRLYMRRFSW